MDTNVRINEADSKRKYGEQYATGYDQRRFETTEGRYAQQFELELFTRLLKSYGVRTLLDAPVGTGRVALPLAREFDITGADISPAMLASAKERAAAEGIDNVAWIECSVDRLPFSDGHFDGVVTARLFQHVPKAMANTIVRELARVVRPEGIVILQFRSGLYGLVLKFIRYYIVRRTGNIRHKCIFPDQMAHYFSGLEIVGRYGYKFPGAGVAAKFLGFGVVSSVERVLASIPGVRWLGKYMTFVVRRVPSGAGARVSA